MKTTWIVLANAGRARILARETENGALVEVLDLIHPQSREKTAELTSDREGHAQKAHGDPGRAGTAFQPQTMPHQKEQAAFAQEIALHLENAVAQGRCAHVALIASDPFLGVLKSRLGSATKPVLRASVPRDLTIYAGADLANRVRDALSGSHAR